MNQSMMDRYFQQNPAARASLDELNARAAARHAELEREAEIRRQADEAKLAELRRVGQALHDDRIAAERAKAEAARAEAEAAARAKAEDEVKTAFLLTGGTAQEWETEGEAILREDRRRRALEALERDKAFWKQQVQRAGSFPTGGR